MNDCFLFPFLILATVCLLLLAFCRWSGMVPLRTVAVCQDSMEYLLIFISSFKLHSVEARSCAAASVVLWSLKFRSVSRCATATFGCGLCRLQTLSSADPRLKTFDRCSLFQFRRSFQLMIVDKGVSLGTNNIHHYSSTIKIMLSFRNFILLRQHSKLHEQISSLARILMGFRIPFPACYIFMPYIHLR